MFKLNKKYSVIGLGLFIAFVLALFPTSSFISKPYRVDSLLKQQDYNKIGLYTITPFEAAKFYSYEQSNCFWIDIRNQNEFSKDHLPIALNQTLNQLEESKWNANNLILVYGNNTYDAQEGVAILRQIVNARAFAIKGGFNAVKKYLISPIGIDIISNFDDKNLETLINVRNLLSGQKTSPDQLLENLKKSKASGMKEGC